MKSADDFLALANDLASHKAVKRKKPLKVSRVLYALLFFALGALLASAVWWGLLTISPEAVFLPIAGPFSLT